MHVVCSAAVHLFLQQSLYRETFAGGFELLPQLIAVCHPATLRFLVQKFTDNPLIDERHRSPPHTRKGVRGSGEVRLPEFD